jgi:hypothetical protein
MALTQVPLNMLDPSQGGFSFRNRLINGSGIIGQRGTVTLSGANASYGADRWLAAVSGGSSVTATTYKSSFGGSTSGSGIWITGTFTTGLPYWSQRLEAQNVVDMNSKTVTVSGLLYQDTGSSQNFIVRLTKANTADTFSSVTTIGTSSSFAIPSGVVTPFAVQFTLGSTDASNGIAVEVYGASAITVTSKNFAISDMQFEIGANKTPFEVRPVGVELALCQRYYYQFSASGLSDNACAYSPYSPASYAALPNSSAILPMYFPVTMRGVPQVVGTPNTGSINRSTATTGMVVFQWASPTTANSVYYISAYTASAEL